MTAIVPLHFEAAAVRMIVRNGEPWWVGIDITAMLGIKKPHQALDRLDDYERGTYIIGTPSGDQEMIAINESGVYSLLLTSRKPVAKQFKRWLITEVLPSIRKFGMYPPPPVEQVERHGWCDGIEKPLGERFREERLRWEAETGVALAEIPSFSRPVINAIERYNAGVDKGQRVVALLRAGLDVLYILTGHRTVSPQERLVLNHLRNGDYQKRGILPMSLAAIRDD